MRHIRRADHGTAEKSHAGFRIGKRLRGGLIKQLCKPKGIGGLIMKADVALRKRCAKAGGKA